jgi:hypothetical protein
VRRFLALGAFVLPLVATAAPAAPTGSTADIVVVWAPGSSVAPLEQVARARGAAVVDRSPAPPASVETAKFLQRGIDAYQAIRLDEAQAALVQARDLADKTGAAGLTRVQLSDLFLYRGLLRAAQSDDGAAWDELVSALVVYPSRTLDSSQYAPKVQELMKRVYEDVLTKRPQASIEIEAPPGCTVYVDAEPVAGAVLRPTGPHFARVACNDHEPWATRIDLTTLGAKIPATPKPYEPPPEAELLVQARSAGALVVIEVHGRVATLRLIGVDGRERERRAVTVTNGDLAPVAPVLDALLAPAVVVRTPWYRTRWAWAVGAAVVTAAIVVPITAAIAGDNGATTAVIRPKGFAF